MRLIFCFILSFAMLASADEAPRRNQIEELFIWKISDELKLTPHEEKKVSEIIKSTNQKKAELLKDLETEVAQLHKSKSEQEKAKILSVHKKTLETYGRLPVKELDQIQKVLGVIRVAKYIEIKAELTSKVKSLLSDKMDKKEVEKKALPPPKIIEE